MSSPSLSKSALLVAGGMLLGRVSGLLRELALASQFGLTRDGDIAMLSVTLPDTLNSLFIGGAISAVLIPELHRLEHERGSRIANALIIKLLVAVSGVSILLSLLLAALGSPFVGILAPGFSGTDHDRAVGLIRIVLIAFPLCTLTAVTTGALQAREKLIVPAFATLLFNVFLIVAVWGTPPHRGLLWLGGAVVVAACVRLASQIGACRQAGLLTLASARSDVRCFTRDLSIRYAQAMVAVGCTVLLPIVGRAFASYEAGGLACFNYAFKLVELPVGVLAAVLTMAVFPRISKAVNHGNRTEGVALARAVTIGALVLSGAALIAIRGSSNEIASLLFLRGRVDAAQVHRIAVLSRIAFLALPAFVLTIHLTSVFHAFKDTKYPFACSMVLAMAFPCLAWGLSARWGLSGTMMAIVVAHWSQMLALAIGLERRHHARVFGGPSLARWAVFSALILVTVVCDTVAFGPSTLPQARFAIAAANAVGWIAGSAWVFRLRDLLSTSARRSPDAAGREQSISPIQRRAA